MKKFLLFAIAALATVSASAASRVKVAPQPKEKAVALTTKSSFGGIVADKQLTYQFPEVKAAKHNIQAAKRTEEVPELIPAFSEWTYYYTPIAGGMIPQIMYGDAKFLVTDDGKAYLQPFSLNGVLEGKVEKDVANQYTEEGYDSITFDCSKVFARYKDSETGETKELFLEPSDWVNYTPVRAGQKSFGAYYSAEEQNLYIPSSVILGLYEADESKTEVFDDAYVACALDLIPQTSCIEYISKGVFEAKSYYGSSYDYSGECLIYLGSYAYNVQGIDGTENEKLWTMFEMDEKDETLLTVFENQYMGTYMFYDDSSRTSTHRGVVATVGLLQENGELTGFNSADDYASTYKITDNANETTTIANTANTVYGDYIYAEEGHKGGMYNAVDLNITITYEPIEVGVDALKANAKQNKGVYNMAGQRVNDNYKGLVVKNGKKVLVK